MSVEIVRQVAQENPELIQENTYESCFEHTLKVLAKLNQGGEKWGLVGKTESESQFRPESWAPKQVNGFTITGFSHDAIKRKSDGQVVDTLGNASANSDPDPSIHGPAMPIWTEVPREHWRKENPFVSAKQFQSNDTTSTKPVEPAKPQAPVFGFKSREQLLKEVNEINEFYKSDLKRPGGLVIDWEPVNGSPYPVRCDIEAVGSWLYNLVCEGWTVEQCKAKIRESGEWKIKNQNGGQ